MNKLKDIFLECKWEYTAPVEAYRYIDVIHSLHHFSENLKENPPAFITFTFLTEVLKIKLNPSSIN